MRVRRVPRQWIHSPGDFSEKSEGILQGREPYGFDDDLHSLGSLPPGCRCRGHQPIYPIGFKRLSFAPELFRDVETM